MARPSSQTTTFSLRDLIREQFESIPDADPNLVASAVLKLVPDEHLREALAVCLPSYVMSMAGTLRRRIPEPFHPAPPALTPLAPPVTYNARGRRITLTNRERATREYAAELKWRLAVGQEQWKFLADCTKADLLEAARIRREQAAGNIAWAERWERLAKVMTKKQTVADLPEHIRREAIQ